MMFLQGQCLLYMVTTDYDVHSYTQCHVCAALRPCSNIGRSAKSRKGEGGGGLSFGVHVLASAAEASVFKGVLIPGE